MGDKSAIEWTDATWNVLTGCSKVSQGCKHCYAERIWPRVYGDRPFTDVKFHEDRLDLPLRWKRPRRIFVNSLSDLFHEHVDFEVIRKIFNVIAESQQHTFQILTKRPERMLAFAQWLAGGGDISTAEWPRNAWMGVSCEDQRTADERIPFLLTTPAAVRWVSAEPLLGPISFRWAKWYPWSLPGAWTNHLDGLRRLNWIVVGGESGPNARPMHPAWARTIRDQCVEAKVPFFFKQWGNWIGSGQVVDYPVRDRELFKFPDGQICSRFDKKTTGRLLDGEEWSQYPA